MKRLFRILPLCAICVGAETTIYGATGLQFVPTGELAEARATGIGVGASMDDDPGWHSSLRTTWMDGRLELALANTWSMVESDSNGFSPSNLPVPIVPSLKYVLDHDNTTWQAWSYAAGFAMPYGAYGAVTWKLKLPLLSPSVTAGMGTPIKTFHAFGGIQVDLCDIDGNRLPLSILLDGSYAGSTKVLGESAEAFWSLGVSTDVGRNLTFQIFHRRDRHYEAPADKQNTGRSFLQLSWNFDGVKSVPNPVEIKP